MSTLKLEHLAPYLPYKLRIVNVLRSGQKESFYEMEVENENDKGILNVLYGANQIPVLRPLSDIIKQIDIDGDKFVPLHRLLEESNFNLNEMPADEINSYYAQFTDIDFLHYNDALLLIKWHFDVFGLIEKRLALSVHHAW